MTFEAVAAVVLAVGALVMLVRLIFDIRRFNRRHKP